MQYTPPLDPEYMPAAVFNRAYQAHVQSLPEQCKAQLCIALERENGLIGRHDIIISTNARDQTDTYMFVERHLKFVLWSQGGQRFIIHGPEHICKQIKQAYANNGERDFDSGIMKKVYARDFEVVLVNSPQDVPAAKTASQSIGGHLEGCRIGFDLGASDYKLAAVQDGTTVFSTEIPWDPVPQNDPHYHYEKITEGLKTAAGKLPRVDAIGGSAAGIYIDNEVKVASIFRGVPEKVFNDKVKGFFRHLGSEWGVPLVVVNDGDVTALAGAMSLSAKSLLGIAMGSSEAAGYVDHNACITGCLNELAFAPVDMQPEAAMDEWSGDRGVGALYFSQQAVNRLLPLAGIDLAPDMTLPEKLKEVQAMADNNDSAALKIFETIGIYLGYSLVHYHDYYRYENALLLGRVTSGKGGEMILSKCRETLQGAFPDAARQIAVKVPDEQSRRVGQAVAAASLPEIHRGTAYDG